ncbi:MAG: hypothetical protein AM326_03965 [Candidatus Thorarchaeota archaeon SMTZ-45]|nr:MAG: hypothetical protein AM326_03965 [Candidatus Thorarchaeota archaeon SMTZ-45]
MRIEELVDKKHFPLWGILGAIVGLIFILTPQIFYVGALDEPFSMFNHYVSELGELGVSELAWMFNAGMVLAGILFIPFMIGLGFYIDNIISKITILVSVFSCVSIVFVGIYPMNYLTEHSISAISFFLSGMVMTFLWAIAILFQKEFRIHKGLSLGGFLNVTIFILFLYGPWESTGGTRPEFSMSATLEWAIYFAIVGYLLTLALYVWRKESRVKSDQ